MKVLTGLFVVLSSALTCRGDAINARGGSMYAAAVKVSRNSDQRADRRSQQAWEQVEKTGSSLQDEIKRLERKSGSSSLTPRRTRKPARRKPQRMAQRRPAGISPAERAARQRAVTASKQRAARKRGNRQRSSSSSSIGLSNQPSAYTFASKPKTYKPKTFKPKNMYRPKSTYKPKTSSYVSRPKPAVSSAWTSLTSQRPKTIDLTRSVTNHQSLSTAPRRSRRNFMESPVAQKVFAYAFTTVVAVCFYSSVSTLSGSLIDETAFSMENALADQQFLNGAVELVSVMFMLHPSTRQLGSFFVTLLYTASLMYDDLTMLGIGASGSIAALAFIVFVNDILRNARRTRRGLSFRLDETSSRTQYVQKSRPRRVKRFKNQFMANWYRNALIHQSAVDKMAGVVICAGICTGIAKAFGIPKKDTIELWQKSFFGKEFLGFLNDSLSIKDKRIAAGTTELVSVMFMLLSEKYRAVGAAVVTYLSGHGFWILKDLDGGKAFFAFATAILAGLVFLADIIVMS